MTKKLTIVIVGQGMGIIRSLKVFFYFPGAGLGKWKMWAKTASLRSDKDLKKSLAAHLIFVFVQNREIVSKNRFAYNRKKIQAKPAHPIHSSSKDVRGEGGGSS